MLPKYLPCLALVLLARPAGAVGSDLHALLSAIPRRSEMVTVTRAWGGVSNPLLQACRELSLPDLSGSSWTEACQGAVVTVTAVSHFYDSSAIDGCTLLLLAPHQREPRAWVSSNCKCVDGFGTPVWKRSYTYTRNGQERVRASQWFCFPRPNLCLEAFDEASLRETLARLRASRRDGLPPALQERFPQVSSTAPFWAIRAEPRQIAEESPWYGESPEWSSGPPSALCLEWVPTNEVRVRLLGSRRSPDAIFHGVSLPFEQRGQVYEASIRADRKQPDLARQQLQLAILLGYRFYI